MGGGRRSVPAARGGGPAMSLSLSSRWFKEATTAEGYVAGLRLVDVRGLALLGPEREARTWRETFAGSGVRVAAVAPEAARGHALAPTFAAACAQAAEVASALRAPVVLLSGGSFPGEAGRRLEALGRRLSRPTTGETTDPEALRAELLATRQGARERLVEQIARALHGPLAQGVPLAVANGLGPEQVLGFTETGWLLDALPRLGLWLDPLGAEQARRQGWGPGGVAWTDAYGGRTVGALAHGAGSAGTGHAHPEDQGADWGSLGESLPRRLPWILDVTGSLSAADVRDAVRYLTAAGAFGRGGAAG